MVPEGETRSQAAMKCSLSGTTPPRQRTHFAASNEWSNKASKDGNYVWRCHVTQVELVASQDFFELS